MVTEAASGGGAARDDQQAAYRDNQGATEYRGVSVLMADLVGSTDLMEDLGAEGYTEILRRFHAICNTAVRKRGGVVAQYQGDGIICYFGFPYASEDDAVRAIEASLGIVEGLRDAGGNTTFAARIGISSGAVMIRSDGDEFGANAIGAAINRAARLEALADVNAILVCHDTRKLVGSMFNLKDLGPKRLKGFRQDENVFLVTGTRRGIATRFESLRGQVTGALVGRDAELGRMHEIFANCGPGSGRTVILSADAGIGKSRLVQAFLHGFSANEATAFVLQCSPENSSTPLTPVNRYLEWVAGAGPSDNDASRHNKIKRLFQKVWQTDAIETDLLLDLLSPLGPEADMDPSESIPLRRRRALTLLADKFFDSVAGRGTLVLVIEDVHWIDPTSAAFIEIVVAKAASRRAMVVLTTRRAAPYGAGIEGAELIEIGRLNDADSHRLARQILAGANLSEEHFRQITEKGEGVPLFLEEYADMLREAKASDLAGDKVPLTLAGLVQSKLDRLDPNTRMFAQAGSALGRSFSPDLVERVLGLTPLAVGKCTAALEAVRLMFRHGTGPGDNSLVFSHALVRDAIYGSMSSDGRKRLHNAIAGAFLVMGIESTGGEQVMAYHLKHAGRFDEAAGYYLLAGIRAAGRGAAFEALAHLEGGLSCVAHLPRGPERDARELQLLAVRGPTQMVTRGPGNPDFGATQARAMELVDILGLHEEMVPVIYNTALHAWAVADLDRARKIADAIALIEQKSPSDAAYLAANTMQGLIAWHQGRNLVAAERLGNTVARHDPKLHHDLYAKFLKEFGVFSLFYLGLTHSALGDFDKGRECADKAFALAEAMGFPHAHGFGLLARFNTALMRGDVDGADEVSAESYDFAALQGFPEFMAMSQFCQGWAKARRGDLEGGVAQMRGGLDLWSMTGFTCWQALFAGYLCRDMIALGRLPDAEQLIGRYTDLIDRTGENQHRALLLLATAELQDARGQTSVAAMTAGRAREVARSQNAALWLSMVEERFPE